MCVYEFGEFRLDASERLLLRKGEALPLTPKVLDTLLLLVEEHGRLIKKDEFMQRLWPGTYISEDTLAHNISVIRKVLGDGTKGQTFIATVSKGGYRFVAEVREIARSEPAPTESQQKATPPVESAAAVPSGNEGRSAVSVAAARGLAPVPARSSPSIFRVRTIALILAMLLMGFVAGFVVFSAMSPTPVPTVVGITQITHSGRLDPWGRLISDGSRIYFLEREGDHWNLTQTSLSGGESQLVTAPFQNTVLLDLSPNRSEFLIASFTQRGTQMPLYTWPVQGGGPTRIGEVTAYDAAWHPNGQQIVYGKEDAVFLADRDGSHVVKLASMRGQPFRFTWSPDGRFLRFSKLDLTGTQSESMWEVNADGTHLHQLLPHWNDPPIECCGSWSKDGSYFFFTSRRAGPEALWGLQEKMSLFDRRQEPPFRLTAGPVNFSGPPVTSGDGRRLYAFGSDLKAELVSYDQGSRRFTTILPGSRAEYATYSRDGEWIAYVTIPDASLWKVKRDGSVRTPITSAPFHATFPTWSPDGKQIAFVNHTTACENKVYLVSAGGGTPRELFPHECGQFDPSWSPDGKSVAVARIQVVSSGASAATIQIVDVASSQVATLPGSQGMRAPVWSPDGRLIAAVTEDLHHALVFDTRTQKWNEIAQGNLFNGALRWSRDGRFVYIQDLLGRNQAVDRIRLSDHRREEVVNFEAFIRAGLPRCALADIAPDGSLIATLLRNHADIYALDLSR